MRFDFCRLLSGLLAGASVSAPLYAQDRLNQADPTIVERALPTDAKPQTQAAEESVAPAVVSAEAQSAVPRIASAIMVEGAPTIPRAAFSDALVPFIGRNLSGEDLSALVRAVADVARKDGYPFASAWIEPQALTGGVLRVRIDAGTVSAVRVIGAINPQADRILSAALVGDQPVRREQLERAILLVGDLPGVTVQGTKFTRQNGFGILLVTIAQDRASGFAQIDNRGSKEIGPIRSTLLGNLRNLIGSGDELGIIGALTQFDWSEFGFGRLRYTAPIDTDGATLSASFSYGRTHPGASLAALNVIGKSVDAAAAFTKPLKRSRAVSLWGALEFRGLRTRQSLLGAPLREDRLATLTASLTAAVKTGEGALRAQLLMTSGLPLAGVTHQGQPRSSRSDGDARFVTWGYSAEWIMPLDGKWSVALASDGQLASRPLLATAEIGAGGPTFGRAYDYAERTGENGILGSAELRYEIGAIGPVLDRLQLYASVDGGYVGNLRGGRGGGSLLSTGAGLRAGKGRLSGTIEIGFPLNEDRFDTRNRDPRLSFRIAHVF